MGAAPFLSSSWYRIAALRPSLREHALVQRHRYRGRAWYIVRDGLAGRVHRLSLSAYLFVALMDGKRTIDELWTDVVRQTGDNAPTQDETIQLLSQLHTADILHSDAPPDTFELFERFSRQRGSRIKQLLLNPLSPRIPLWDPDPFLERTLPTAHLLFGWCGALLWIGIVGSALVLAAQHWSELSENVTDRLLATENVLLLSLIYPIVKALHEFGHGYATKVFGGEVHEAGVMLLMGLPTPYVDATAAAGFRSKFQRSVVGAAGMLVEVFLAAVALHLWLTVEPGLLRSVCFNVIAIAGVSTVVFNANPLMRYDGYYILSDLIEIPNLAMRSTQYCSYWVDKYVFAAESTRPEATAGEARWFVAYAPAAFIYRLSVQFSIAFYLASQWFIIGIILALWSVATSVVLPIYKAMAYVVSSPRLRRQRVRAVCLTGGGAIVGALLLFWIPAPLHTTTEGVVWLPESATVRAGTGGFARRLLAEPGVIVEAGAPLVEMEDSELRTRVKVLEAQVEELQAQFAAEQFTKLADAQVVRFELEAARSALKRESERADRLVVRSSASGRFLVAKAADLPGRFFRAGDVLGYVTPASSDVVRVTVPQDDIDLVRHHLRGAVVKLVDRLGETYPAALVREVPAADNELPSKALGTTGGGISAVDPGDREGRKTIQRLFQFDLALAPDVPAEGFGARVYVRFDHEWEPLGTQIYRRLRQLFLTRLNA